MLEGRTIVVTGAARGVGRAIAFACARHGARLVLGDVLSEPGRRTAAELAAQGAVVRYEDVDIAEPDSIERFAASIRQHEGACTVS
jgi:NAD(P)-dependent dehydrogenase (short-subunit alcohol dehydrogenase family)